MLLRRWHVLQVCLLLGGASYIILLYRSHTVVEDHIRSIDRTKERPQRARKPAFDQRIFDNRPIRPPVTPELLFRKSPGDKRPPFDTVVLERSTESDGVYNATIVGDVSSLLDFAVIGFGKCGTTSMLSWLDLHPQLQTYPREVYDLMQDNPAALVKKLYSLPVGNVQRGYKSPVDMSLLHTMQYFQRYFYRTKLIVGIRHPVRWFESLYNFRIQNARMKILDDFPHPNELVGRCFARAKNACTYKGEFALFLRHLGKTLHERNATTNEFVPTLTELNMYRAARFRIIPNVQHKLENPVFLFEMTQLFNDTDRLAEDVASFLNVEVPSNWTIPHKIPGKDHWTEEQQAAKDRRKMNICGDEFIPLRTELMRQSRVNSLWIRRYLLPHVAVSSPASFEQILREEWMQDPCGGEATSKAGSYIVSSFREYENFG